MQTARQDARGQPAHPAERDDGAGDLRWADVDQVRARREADGSRWPCIGAAAILDGIDGGIARALNAQSRMGAEIDSLADAVNFGVAPALVVYVTLLPHSRIGWIFVLLYAVCVVLRLARFNALLDDDTSPPTRASSSPACPRRAARSARSARWSP